MKTTNHSIVVAMIQPRGAGLAAGLTASCLRAGSRGACHGSQGAPGNSRTTRMGESREGWLFSLGG